MSNNEKNRLVAIVLALFLGGFGIHWLYLGKTGRCILYALFFWTFIPAFLAFIDIIRFAIMSEKDFQLNYA